MKVIQVKNPDNLKTIDYKNLKPLQGDLKRIITDEAKAKLKNSILKHGFFIPAFVWKNNGKNYILDAHQRQKVLWELEKDGYEIPEIPIVEIQAKNRKDAAEKLLQINSRYAEINPNTTFFEDFDLDLDILNDIEIPELDFDILQGENEGLTDDDAIPEEVESVCKIGNLWKLDKHRLLVDDCIIKKNVELLMNDKKANMLFCDPPYGIDLDTDFSDMEGIGKGKKYKKIKGDEYDYDPKDIFSNFGYCKEIFLWGADYYAERILNRNDGSWIVWDKTEGGIRTNSAYDKMYGSNFELCWSKGKHKRALAKILWKGIFGLGKEDTKKRIHPTQKPVELCKWFIEKFSKQNQIIVDLYGGSGSTMIACEKLKRQCYMMEILPEYCDVIIERWQNFTGEKAELINVR